MSNELINIHEAIFKHVKANGSPAGMRGGYPKYEKMIRNWMITVYTEDEGYTHGIFSHNLIDCWHMDGRNVEFSREYEKNGPDILTNLYKACFHKGF